MHIYIYICMYICICVYTYICIYMYLCIFMYLSIHLSIQLSIYLSTYYIHDHMYVQNSVPQIQWFTKKRTRNSTPQKHLQWSSRPRKTLGIPILWEKKEFNMIEPTTRKGLAIANAFGALIFSSFFGEPLNLQKSI